MIVISQLAFPSHVSVLFGFEKNLWSHYHWFNFDFFIYPFNTHCLSTQPVYVNQWLHNHLTNLCNVPSGNWDFSEFCQSNISPLVSSETTYVFMSGSCIINAVYSWLSKKVPPLQGGLWVNVNPPLPYLTQLSWAQSMIPTLGNRALPNSAMLYCQPRATSISSEWGLGNMPSTLLRHP